MPYTQPNSVTSTSQGPAASGTAVTGNPVLEGGSDGTNVRNISTDTSGRQVVVGASAVAAAAAGNPVLSGGSDGTNARYILVDTSGRQIAVGAGASGSALVGNPVLVAGSDATNARSLLVDTSGRQLVAGASAVGAAVAGNPVLVGGSDGTNARYLALDTTGRLVAVGAAASGSAVAGNPVLVGGSDGTNARAITTNALGVTLVAAGQSTRATYVVSVQGVAYTAATQAIVIEAPAGSPVYITRLVIWQTGTDTTNAVINFQLLRTTTAGTGGAVTPALFDPADSAFGGICRSAPSPAGTAGTVLFNIPLDVPNAAAVEPLVIMEWGHNRIGKMPVIPAGTANGIALLCPATAGAANFAASIEFIV